MHLDTNFLVAMGKNGSTAQRQAALWIVSREPLHVSSMTWAEYLCGPLDITEGNAILALLNSVIPLSAEAATLGAELFNRTGRRSRSLPDCLIAATAILHSEPLATLNLQDFVPFLPFGLKLR